MNLFDVKIGVDCIVKKINISDEKTKLRIMELGINKNTKIKIYKKSILKKTMLVIFHSTCFTLKDNLAKEIVVEYA